MTKIETTDTVAKNTKAAVGAAAGLPPADIGEAVAANRAMMDEVVAANHEINAFVGKRLRADAETFTRLCQCRDWTEAMAVQIEFMSRFAEDYFEETDRLMDRAARMLENGPLRGGGATKKKT